MEHMSHEEYVQQQRERVATVAEAMLTGRVGIIAGSRELRSLEHEVAEGRGSDFAIFVVVDSETDHPDREMVRSRPSKEKRGNSGDRGFLPGIRSPQLPEADREVSAKPS